GGPGPARRARPRRRRADPARVAGPRPPGREDHARRRRRHRPRARDLRRARRPLRGLPGGGGMTREYIEVTGARENNLRDVSVRVPKRAITAFVGVSGSGKSSLVFDTIAAEAQRQLNETFSAFVQGFLPHYGQPDVDRIEHLNAPIILDLKRFGGGSRSTACTYTD